MLKKLFGQRAAREKWDTTLVWFRLRYSESDSTRRCINLLSRPQACQRVALCYWPGKIVSRLYLGIPETHIRLLQRMAGDFGFSLKPKLPEVTIPPAQRMTAVTELPWDKPFIAHIVNECVFVSLLDGGNQMGAYLPRPPTKESRQIGVDWHLPDEPLPGLTLRPAWNDQRPSEQLVVTEPDPRRWLLGRSHTGIPLHVSGAVNIYGRREAVADWLRHQMTQTIALDHANLVVIDGTGDLVPRLKRKTAVTQLLGKQLAYVDIGGSSLVGGFNPLAIVPGETDSETVLRWQRWFQGMNVHPQSLALLARAKQAGVADIPSLRKWLQQAERRGGHTAVSSLRMALERLMATRSLREWLEWPTNPFDVLPEGTLLFTIKGTDWASVQLLRAVLSSALSIKNVRLLVHGFPWKAVDLGPLTLPKQLVISNGPLIPRSAIVLTESTPPSVTKLTKRFLCGDSLLSENLSLLTRGEGLAIVDEDVMFTTWKNQQVDRGSIPN